MNTEFDGHWFEPEGIPRGEVVWLPPGKAGLKVHIATINGAIVAKVRGGEYGRGWTANVPGWKWNAPLAGSVADKMNIRDPHLKGFLTAKIAKKAVEHALAALPVSEK